MPAIIPSYFYLVFFYARVYVLLNFFCVTDFIQEYGIIGYQYDIVIAGTSLRSPYRRICSLMVVMTISGISYREYCLSKFMIFAYVKPAAAAFHRERGEIL